MPELSDVWPIVLASVPVLAALIAGTNAWLAARNERRRTQPVVITHEHRKRGFATGGDFAAIIYLTNDSLGPAFNVRCGICMKGYEFPFRGTGGDDRGRLWRVIPAGKCLPRAETDGSTVPGFPLLLPGVELAGLEGDPDEGRVYWSRYENAHGQTWETRNPADPSIKMTIRRVRFPKRRERAEAHRLEQLRIRGARVEERMASELRAGSDAAVEADDESRHPQ